eukprot:gene10786-11757_t
MGSGASRVQSMSHDQPETIVVDRVIETLSPRTGGTGSHQNHHKIREIQVRNHGLDDSDRKDEQPTPTIQKEEKTSSGMKYIFSSLPCYLSSYRRHSNNIHQQMVPNPQINNTNTSSANSKTNDVNDHVSHFSLNRNPFDSIKLSLLSKPLNGKTIIMQNKSKNKYKNVRTIAVTSPRDQK